MKNDNVGLDHGDLNSVPSRAHNILDNFGSILSISPCYFPGVYSTNKIKGNHLKIILVFPIKKAISEIAKYVGVLVQESRWLP